MITFPNAKINLGLQVIAKRDDGYHEVQTVMYPIDVYDALEFQKSETNVLVQHGLRLDNEAKDNIVLKAFELLRKDFPHIPSLEIHLLKHIPFGAGLGGGSSDAAFFISTLNNFYQLQLSVSDMEKYASILGSDCAFFIQNKAAYAYGRGEQLEPIELDLSMYSIQLICPEVHVSTKEAYNGIVPKTSMVDLREALKEPIKNWRQLVYNDFETSLFPIYPVLGSIKHQLYDQHAFFASMSGSGSSVFGIFPKNKKANIVLDIGFREFIC